MRCENCGWENPVNNTKCEKCNAPFSDIMNEVNNDQSSVEKSYSDKLDPKKTAKCCPECGYPIRMIEKNCPQCGYVFNDEKLVAPEAKEPAPCEVQQPAPVAPVQNPDIPKPDRKSTRLNSSH